MKTEERVSMKSELNVVGIDLAQSIFHLVGMGERGKMMRAISRRVSKVEDGGHGHEQTSQRRASL
jgi:hypothetical protein